MSKHKIAIISDTHLKTDWYYDGIFADADILIHCGDFCNSGKMYDFIEFLNFFKKIPVENKILVPGNHDWCCENSFSLVQSMCSENDIIMLNHGYFEFNGFKIFGTPYQPIFCNWAFNIVDHKRQVLLEQIPYDTNVLITHCPPYGILDVVTSIITEEGMVKHLGDPILKDVSKKLKNLKLHCFGHIHDSYGQTEADGVIYVNASICNEQYQPVNKPIIIEI